MEKFLQTLKNLFQPNRVLSGGVFSILCASQIIFALMIWSFFGGSVFPKPLEIIQAWLELVTGTDFIFQLLTSTILALEATVLTFIISLLISYSSVLAFFQPFCLFISKMRFLSMVGLQFMFLIMINGGHQLKLTMLVFGVSVFMVTGMIAEIGSITQNQKNHARTLGMNEWHLVWEVVILGKMDKAFEILRQNFAMAWMMLSMVEVVSRSEGGIGVMLANQNKYFALASVFAIQGTIFTLGIGMDWLLGVVRNLAFPYACLKTQTK